jgi:hypothetical protein
MLFAALAQADICARILARLSVGAVEPLLESSAEASTTAPSRPFSLLNNFLPEMLSIQVVMRKI